jgi:Mrp family chromosome partitioning ATPase
MESQSDMGVNVLQSVFDGLRASPRSDGLGQIIQVLSATTQSGTSHVARNLALIGARQPADDGKRVGLFDCDYAQLAQTNHFFTATRANQMQGPYDASFGAQGCWHIAHSNGSYSDNSNICGLYIDSQTGLAVTSLFWDQLYQSDRVTLRQAPPYWQVLRSHFSYVFVDCPALDRSTDGLLIAPDCDQTILVAKADTSSNPVHQSARDKIIQAGGRYSGLLLNAGAPMRLINQTAEQIASNKPV